MTPTPKCPTCGASMKKSWHRVTAGMAVGLIKMNRAVNFYRKNDVHMYRLPPDMDTTFWEKSNWTKLRYNGLVAKIRENGQHKKGRWCITRKGYGFLHGQAIPEEVQSFHNRVTAHSDRMVTIGEVLRRTPYWQQIEDIRFEYAEPTVESDLEQNQAVVTRAARTKKNSKPLCPTCNNVLVTDFTTRPQPDNPNAVLIVAKFHICRKCGYRRELT